MTYKVKLVSQTNAIILIVTLLGAFLTSAGTLLPSGGLQNDGLAILLVSLVASISYILWQIFVTGRTIWTVDEREIKIVWTKKFILSGGEDIVIKWNEVKDISRGLDSNYYKLKIKLVSGETIKYFHDTMTTRDDFENTLKTLYKHYVTKKLQPTQVLQ